MAERIPIRELAPIRDYGPTPPLWRFLWAGFAEWFLDKYAYVTLKDIGRPERRFVDAWNDEGRGSSVRIGRVRVDMNWYLPFVEAE